MTFEAHNLQKLISLAEDESTDGRRDLLRSVTDLFMEQPDNHSSVENDHFDGIMGQLAYEVEKQIRQELAERLSAVDSAPHGVIAKLANDDIDVAGPILQNSTVLKNSDLLEIIKHRGQEHMLSISLRKEVSEEVSESLVEHGDDEVVESLVKNEGAEISQSTMQGVAQRAKKSEMLQVPLISRKDLPQEIMDEMYWSVSEALREQITASMPELDEEDLDLAMQNTRQAMLEEMSEEQLSPPERFVRRKVIMGQLDETMMISLLKDGAIAEFVAAFSHLTGIDHRTAQRIIYDRGAEALAITCKASGFSPATLSTIAKLIAKDEPGKWDDVHELLDMYDKLPMHTAQRTMRFWRIRQQSGGENNH